jgi:hypothetical protein
MQRTGSLLASLGMLEDSPTAVKFQRIRQSHCPEVAPKQYQIIRLDGTESFPKLTGDRANIVTLNDVHYGSSTTHQKMFEDYVKYVAKTPDTYAIGLGDLLENATKVSIGRGVYEQQDQIQEQMDYIECLLRPLVREGKLLGLQPGNHEERSANIAGIDPMRMIAKLLGVPYMGWQAYWQFVLPNQTYKVMTWHGKSGAGTKGGRINAVRRMNQIADMDLYIMGHVHDLQTDCDEIFDFDPKTQQVVRRKRHYVVAGSTLTYFGGYAEMAGFSPSGIGLVQCELLDAIQDIKVVF